MTLILAKLLVWSFKLSFGSYTEQQCCSVQNSTCLCTADWTDQKCFSTFKKLPTQFSDSDILLMSFPEVTVCGC